MCKCAKIFSFWGPSLPDPLPGLCPWTPLGDFSPSKLLIRHCLFWASLGEPPPQKKKIDETEEPEAGIHGWMTVTKISVPICLYCLNCTKFGQLILRKIINIVASRCQILRLKCINFDFGWGSAPDHAGGAYRVPHTP